MKESSLWRRSFWSGIAQINILVLIKNNNEKDKKNVDL
jgi:hypothetical protein